MKTYCTDLAISNTTNVIKLDIKLQKYNWPDTPYWFFCIYIGHIPWLLTTTITGLANQEHVLTHTISHLILFKAQTSRPCDTGWFQNLLQRSSLFTNGFVNHNLYDFCWTLLQYHKQLLHHIRLDTCITLSRWCHHYFTQLTSRFRPLMMYSLNLQQKKSHN